MSAQVRPSRQLLAEPVVARQTRAAGRDQVAHARETGEGQRVGAGGDPEPGHLGQAAGQQAGLAVVAEAESVGRAGGDRHDVLERPAQLDAEDVLVDVEPEPAPAEPLDDALARGEVPAATTADAGRLRATSAARFGPGQRGDSADRHAAGLGDDLAHAQQRAALEALDDRQQVRRRIQERAAPPPRPSRAGAPTATAKTHEVGRQSASADGSAVAATAGRQVDARQSRLVPPGRRGSVPPSPGSGTGASPAPRARRRRASVVPQAPAPTTATRAAVHQLLRAGLAGPSAAARPRRTVPGALRQLLAPRQLDRGAARGRRAGSACRRTRTPRAAGSRGSAGS